MPFTASCVLSRQGHLENSPPLKRWVARSLDEGQAPAGAKKVGARRSAVREHLLDWKHRKPRPREARCSRGSNVAVIAPRDEPSAFGSRMVLKPSMPFPKRLITRSDDGYFVKRPPFQRWVARSLDERQAPAGAKEVDAPRSTVHEHLRDLTYRKVISQNHVRFGDALNRLPFVVLAFSDQRDSWGLVI